MICKVYIFKSYSRHKTKQILFLESMRNIEKQFILLYYSASSTETFTNRNFEKICESLFREFCF